MILTRTFTPDLGADAGDRSLVGLAVPFDTPTEVRDGTGRPYIEAIRADAIDPAEVVGIPVAWRHDEPIGRITDAAAEPAGLNVSLDLADTALGRDATALADLGILGMSIGFRPLESSEDGGTTYRDRIQITEVSLTHQPAYPNTEAATREDTIPMTDTTTTDPAAPTPDPMIRDAVDTLDARMADLTQRVAQLPTHTAAAEIPELARDYGSAGEYVLAVARGDETRALVDQVSPDNPGVWPESWLGGITGIINRGRPFIGGIGGPGSLPATGDEVAWPVYEGGFDLFAEQVTEKTEVASAPVSIGKANVAVGTYATASDISLQLINRSTPSYLDAWMAIHMAAWARFTDGMAAEGAATASTSSVVYDPNTVGSLYPAVVEAALKVQQATGNPASFIAVREASWTGVAGALDGEGRPLYPHYGPNNAPGIASGPGSATLTIAGIPAFPVAGLTSAPFIVSNGLAVDWLEDGPKTISADVIARLGRDYAVYGYAALAARIPAGIVKGDNTAAPVRRGK